MESKEFPQNADRDFRTERNGSFHAAAPHRVDRMITGGRQRHIGAVIHIDAAVGDWLGERAPRCALLIFIDEDTESLMHLTLYEALNIWSFFAAVRQYLQRHGKPSAFHSDVGIDSTYFAPAMRELEIGTVYSPSLTPSVGGVPERVFMKLRGNLVAELKRGKISTIAEANKRLPKFIADFNARFGAAIQGISDIHRPVSPEDDLERALTLVTERPLRPDLGIEYGGVVYYVDPKFDGVVPEYLMIREDVRGSITIEHNGRPLDFLTPSGVVTSVHKIN
jgi:hypothetical protein